MIHYYKLNLHKILSKPLSLLLVFLAYAVSFAQVPTNGDYRTRFPDNGDGHSWDIASNWQVRSGGSWVTAAIPPGPTNNVYIQNGHNINPGFSSSCKDLNINSGAIVIGSSLDVYGKLRCYNGTVVTGSTDGIFYSSQASTSTLPANLDDFIFLFEDNLYIKGVTRNVTNAGEWGPGKIPLGMSIEMNSGAVGTFQTGLGWEGIIVETGSTMNMGTNPIYADFVQVQTGGTINSANSGASGTSCVLAGGLTTACGDLRLYGKINLTGASPHMQIQEINLQPGATVEYSASGNQNFINATYPGTVPFNGYKNLILSGSGNKTPVVNFTVKENINITASAILVMGSRTANITGNWTSYGQAGLTEGTSTINFDSSGNQSLNTTGGENFYIMRKSAGGTLTLNSNVNIVAGGNLNMQAGSIDANATTFSGTATSAFNMSGGTIKLAKLSTTLPEFLITPYNLSGGTIELDGAGTQTLRGARDYRNLTFSNSGTKGITSAINNITGTVTVSGSVVLDVLNNTMGGTGTNLTMSGTSLYKTAGSSQVKPDAAGTYTLAVGTTVEFNNNLAGLESIRLIGAATVNYAKIIVSGSSVGTVSLATGIRFQSGGTFTVKNGAIFKQTNSTGFSGLTTTAISSTNSPSIILETGSTIEYNGDNQTISNQTITIPSFANYEGLILSGTGSKTAPAGNLTIRGDLSKTTTTTSFVHNNGTVIMAGVAAQDYNSTFPGMGFYNFTNNNTVDLSINNELKLTRALSFAANAKLNLRAGGHIILLSTASNTANVGVIPATATINYFGDGKFTVERYISSGVSHVKSWQFLATPTNGGQTVNQAWQDTATAANQNRYSGYGTQLTSNISPLPLRFDVYTSLAPSIKTYNAATNSWIGIANTTSLPIYNQKGYMVFVRGDRSVIAYNGTANVTVLRTSGRIFNPVSNIPPVTNIAATQFESIGNPYASAIDFSNDAAVIKSANVQKVFYVWDSRLGGGFGYGAYQTFTKGVGADNNYYVTPGGGSYGASGSVNNSIQSGQAFFVHTFGGTGTITFTENAKLSTNSMVFRPVNIIGNPSKQLRNNLYSISNGDPVLIDGVVNEFGRQLSNAIDELDVTKVPNSSENISIIKANKELAVERRAETMQTDTIFYKLGQLRVQQYEFEFTPADISRPGLHAFLEDNYLGTKTAVSLMNTTHIRFNIINDPGSYDPERFRLVFKQKHIAVDLSSNEMEQGKNTIAVYPNPVTDNTIRLFFHDQPTGRYEVQLISQTGQLVFDNAITVSGKFFMKPLQVGSVASGNYKLVLTAKDGRKTILHVIIK